MSKLIAGIFLPRGVQVEPEPIFIEDYQSIQQAVGGHFDVVVTDLGKDDVSIVGYVNDEGLIMDLELNYLATNLFKRELRGDCVIVWGLSPNGVYDGDNYDIPEWITEFLFKDLVESSAGAFNLSSLLSDICKYAVSKKLATREEVTNIANAMHEGATTGNIDYEAEDRLILLLQKVADHVDEQEVKDFCMTMIELFKNRED